MDLPIQKGAAAIMRATAAITQSKGAPFDLRDVDIDEPRSNEVLTRVAASGICHTDLIVRDQWYPAELPAALGHEVSWLTTPNTACRLAVVSSNVGRAMALGERLRTGLLHIYDQTVQDDVINPFGGVSASGNGTSISGPANGEEFTQWQ